MNVPPSSIVARVLCVAAVCLLQQGVLAQLPPQRSTVFDGTAAAQIRFPAALYAPSNSLTLEAWVNREDASRCETVVAQDYTTSFWFGFCSDRLRFYRQGGTAIDATRNVPAHRWTHVAVVYDAAAPAGSNTVSFYIDGTLAGGANVRPTLAPLNLPLYLGASPGSVFSTYPFHGALDEVRLWSVARTAGQVRTNRFRELVAEPGLVAVFPGGGTRELVGSRNAIQVAGATPQIAGILPRDLVVPRQRVPVTFDGVVTDAAYDGAEALVVRYPNGTDEFDVTARLVLAPSNVSSTEHLYIAVPLVGSDTSATLLNTAPLWRAYVDRNRGESVAPATNDFRFAYDAYDTAILQSATGNGLGGFVGTNAAPGRFDARTQSGIEFDAPSVELRLTSSTVFSAQPTGFMMDLNEPFRSIIQPGFTHPAPADAIASDTTTWPEIRLGATIGSVANVQVEVHVVNPDRTNAPLAGATVGLFNAVTHTLIARGTTATLGRLNFSQSIPTNTPVQLQLELPAGWRFADTAQVDPGPIAPLATGVATVDFPGRPSGSSTYPRVTFFAIDPPAADATASFSGVEPNTAASAMRLRESPPNVLPAGTVNILGNNFDRGIQAWTVLESGSCGSAPGAFDSDPRDNFPSCEWRPCVPLARTSSNILFQLQYTNRVGSTARVWLYDSWNGRWLTTPDAGVALTEPPYPQVHGFAFENYGDGHDIDDYRTAFPGVVCDPFRMVGFWAFFPIYLDILNDGGECVGMVSSSYFFRTTTAPASFVAGVNDAAGFTAADNASPAFDVGNICAPRPTSTRAFIRSNHGVQTSSQFLGETLGQLQFGVSGGPSEWGGFGGGLYTPMADRLAQIRSAPLNRVVCIKPDLLGSGHALLPLRIRDTADAAIKEVDVYDPNHPGETRVLRVHTTFNRFTYDGFSTPWRGAYLFVHDIPRFWTGGRDIISIDTLGTALDRFGVRGLLELLGVLVSGSAEPLLSFPDGTEWGWRTNRATVSTATNVAEIPSFGELLKPINPLGHGPAQVFFNPQLALPAIDLHARGGHYSFQVAQGGNLFQILADGRIEGDRDQVQLLADADLLRPTATGSSALPTNQILSGFRFQPGRSGSSFTPRIALGQGGTNTFAMFSWSGLSSLPAGAGLRFGADPARGGVLLINDSATPVSPVLSILTPPASGSTPLSNSIALPPIPAGAALGSYLLSTIPGQPVRLRFELDRDRDRHPETLWVIAPDAPPLTEAPTLRAQLEADQVVLHWPAAPDAWVLASADSIDGPWTPSSAVVSYGTGEITAAVPLAESPQKYFRLQKQ